MDSFAQQRMVARTGRCALELVPPAGATMAAALVGALPRGSGSPSGLELRVLVPTQSRSCMCMYMYTSTYVYTHVYTYMDPDHRPLDWKSQNNQAFAEVSFWRV